MKQTNEMMWLVRGEGRQDKVLPDEYTEDIYFAKIDLMRTELAKLV